MTMNRLCGVLCWFSSCIFDVFSIQRNKFSSETEADRPVQHERGRKPEDWVGAQDFSTSYSTHLASNLTLPPLQSMSQCKVLAISLIE